MEWIATAVAVLAALAAVWQAWEARRARTSAKDASDTAESAAARIATALEEQNAMKRAEAEEYRDPWRLERKYSKSGGKWVLTLGGNEAITDVEWTFDPEGEVQAHDDLPAEMLPGDAVVLSWWRSMASPSSVRMAIRWKRPNGESRSTRATFTP